VIEYLAIAAAVLGAAFFSGNETGFYCANRLRLRVRAEKGDRSARALLRLTSRPRLAISTMLVGTNSCVYLASVLSVGKLIDLGLGESAELYNSLIMPPLLLLFAELIPKSLFQHHADVLMHRTVRPLRVAEVAFYPLSQTLQWLGGLPQRLMGRRGSMRRELTDASFRFYLSTGTAQGAMSPFQGKMAENIMRLKGVDVASVMTPLEGMVSISERASYANLLDVLGRHRYSRIPVYRAMRDRIIGAVHVIDAAARRDARPPVRDLVQPMLSIPAGTSVADALWIFRQARRQSAIVHDSEGRAKGIVTAKDLVEEIVGELEAW
jgi:CBS domain containing-hemolysin-like protein